MIAIVTNKTTKDGYVVRAERVKRAWRIGGDKPEYKVNHYIIISKGVEYTLKNGRLIKA
jgi:hypothetical protein